SSARSLLHYGPCGRGTPRHGDLLPSPAAEVAGRVGQTGRMGKNVDRRHLMHIGAVAERTELSLRTLRYYDEIGLVTASERTDGGFRLYSEDDVQRILLIRRMKPLDFTLEQMRELLQATDELSRPGSPADAEPTLAEFETLAIERRAAL